LLLSLMKSLEISGRLSSVKCQSHTKRCRVAWNEWICWVVDIGGKSSHCRVEVVDYCPGNVITYLPMPSAPKLYRRQPPTRRAQAMSMPAYALTDSQQAPCASGRPQAQNQSQHANQLRSRPNVPRPVLVRRSSGLFILHFDARALEENARP
jgi:hypothetical protein